MTTPDESLLRSLDLPPCLRERILCRMPPAHETQQPPRNSPVAANLSDKAVGGNITPGGSFVLYLPTVVLRKMHNPAFALACRLANHYGLPLLVLVTILDDSHLSQKPHSPLVMTSRRLAFYLEALQESCCPDWESHGAGVAVRIHGPGCKTPHHLSLVHAARAVVGDEPFVEPYRTYVRKIAKTCHATRVPFWTVDGSTSVPPNSMLKKKPSSGGGGNHSHPVVFDGDVSFAGAPSKAWRWEKQTDSVRKKHVYAAYQERALDAPVLECKLPPDFFLCQRTATDDGYSKPNDTTGGAKHTKNDHKNNPLLDGILDRLPSKWKDIGVAAPGRRPWSVGELCSVLDCKSWALSWRGADPTVPPCQQTDGSSIVGKRRWRSFVTAGLKDYAKKRNSIIHPHAVSRISCYLNLGILSIFVLLHDVWEAKSTRGYSAGCQKFLDEVVKWREGSYVHAFAHPNYHTIDVLPLWARKHLGHIHQNRNGLSAGSGYSYEELERGATSDETWNAMQEYLIDTGELHNNARMSWGKTVVHWQAPRVNLGESLWQLCCLNDRFALDGLSPPSYGGILWCYGWQDKPASGNRVSEKWAHRYRTGPSGFRQAREELLGGCRSNEAQAESQSSSTTTLASKRRSTSCGADNNGAPSKSMSPTVKKARHEEHGRTDSKSILFYFSPASIEGAQRSIG